MPCTNPPPLSDEIISAVLDGATPPEVLAHLQACGYCATRLDEARQFDGALQGRLLRWDCPTPQQLGDYHFGLAPQATQRIIATHLQVCPTCAVEIEELRVFLLPEDAPAPVRPQMETPAEPRGSRLRGIVAQLLPRTSGYAMAGLRGAGDGPMVAQSSVATIILEPQKADGQNVRLTGQIADEAGDQERWDGALVELRREDKLLASAFVDDLGGFTCPPVAGGQADLRITDADGTWIIVEGVEL